MLIYQFIYSKIGLKNNLPSYLKFRRKKRGIRKSRKRKKPNITNFVSVHDRPKEINERKESGRWEGDLIIFTTLRSKNITTIVERKTRFTKLILNSSKTSAEVIGGIKRSFDGEPSSLKSITFDRGTEFANHHELPASTYFCDPGSPWQKGAVENMNGRIRNLLPKHVRPYFLKQKVPLTCTAPLSCTARFGPVAAALWLPRASGSPRPAGQLALSCKNVGGCGC